MKFSVYIFIINIYYSLFCDIKNISWETNEILLNLYIISIHPHSGECCSVSSWKADFGQQKWSSTKRYWDYIDGACKKFWWKMGTIMRPAIRIEKCHLKLVGYTMRKKGVLENLKLTGWYIEGTARNSK